jgi:predicted Zn-dependent peptidase
VKIVFPAGRVNDPDGLGGISQLAAEMLKEGTGQRGSREIAETLDRLAIDLDQQVMMEHSFVSVTSLRGQRKSAVELLADLTRNPDFPEEELVKVKTRWQSHLIAQRSDPGFLAQECFFGSLFERHPYSKVSVPPDELAILGREHLRGFSEKHYAPEKAYLLFAGDISLAASQQMAGEHFGQWPGEGGSEDSIPEIKTHQKRKVCLVHRPHSVQSHLMVGMRTFGKTDPRYIPLKVMNQVYGGGASSRLFQNLREDKGYTYGAYSMVRSYKSNGVILASASVNSNSTRESLVEILGEMERMVTEPPTTEELERARAELTGSFIRQMETPASVGTLELVRRLAGLPADYYQEYIPNLGSVSASQVVDSAGQFLDPSRSLIVVVGDRVEVEKNLQGFGETIVFDTNRNQVE